MTSFIKENDIKFDSFRRGEDHIFSINAKLSTPIFYIKNSVAFYMIRNGSSRCYQALYEELINSFKKLAQVVEIATGEKVEYIDYRNPKDVYVKIPTIHIRLGSLNPSVFTKIQKLLPSTLPQVNMVNKAKYVDLRWDTSYIKLDK